MVGLYYLGNNNKQKFSTCSVQKKTVLSNMFHLQLIASADVEHTDSEVNDSDLHVCRPNQQREHYLQTG